MNYIRTLLFVLLAGGFVAAGVGGPALNALGLAALGAVLATG